jgi:hypothetical protein
MQSQREMIRWLRLKVESLSLNLPFGIGGVTVEVTAAQRQAAWALYVEYSTRISGSALERGAGSPREALDSLRTLFDSTRQVLREAGPDVAHGRSALGPIAIRALNQGVRPFQVRWHTTLLAKGPDGALTVEERAQFDEELAELREGLTTYVEQVGRIGGVR